MDYQSIPYLQSLTITNIITTQTTGLHMITHNYSYDAILKDALKVNWRVEDLIEDGMHFDFQKKFLPESLCGTQSISCLSSKEKLKLNQIRGNSYLYLFSFVEEFILPFVLDHVRNIIHGDPVEMLAFATFAEEEAKHIHLFKKFGQEFERGFGSVCRCIGPVKEISEAILKHHPLGVALISLHIEWMTQRHYIDSIRSSGENLEPMFTNLLRHHWTEESQHAKLDTLLTEKIVQNLSPEEIEHGINDYFAVSNILNYSIAQQIQLDIESLSLAIERNLTPSERKEIQLAQQRSYRWVFLGSGMSHPNFQKTLGELSDDALEKVKEITKLLS